MLARLASLLALPLILTSTQALAADATLSVGAALRLADGSSSTIGSLRMTYQIEPMVSLVGQLDAYVSAPRYEGTMDLAGWRAGLLFETPLPSLIAPSVALTVGHSQLISALHGVDDTVTTVNAELALTSALGPARVTLSFNRVMWSADPSLSDRVNRSEIGLSVGLAF